VEEAAADGDAGRLGVVHRHVGDLAAGLGVDHRDRVVEPGQGEQLAAVLVEDEAGGAAAGDVDLVGGAGHEAVVLQLGGGEDADLVGARGGGVGRAAVAGDRHALGQGERPGVLVVGDRRTALVEVDVLVEVAGGDGAAAGGRRQHGDPVLVEVAAQAV